jgi:V/A-type H+-transporting ATPase subunit E
MNRTPALDRTVDKVLSQKQEDFITQIDSAYQEAASNLESSRGNLRSEYDKIIQGSRKQAENLKRQILGSKRLESRNQELLLIEKAVSVYFEKARERFRELSRDKEYKGMINEMIDDCISAIGTGDIIIESNEKDSKIVAELLAKKPKKVKLRLSDKPINIIGGLRAMSADGSLTYDSTLELRMERLKPLIRKEIVQTLRGRDE